MPKLIVSGPEARTKLLKGVDLIANAVKRTLGPDGNNCIYERFGDNLSVSSRDGVTVANQIEANDPHENMGVNLLKGVAREAVDSSGDGTTTATLLAQAIFSEGLKAITVGANPVALKRGIERATVAVVESLNRMAIEVSGDMLRQVATISANNDEYLGNLIATAMEKAGDDGVVTVEISRKPESSLEIVDGLQFSTGFLSPYFVNNPERNECILEDVAVLLHEKKLVTIKDMLPVIQQLAQEGKSLLVIAEDVTDEALAILAVNSERKLLKACAVKTPGGFDHLQDIAAMTGAKVITEMSGLKAKDIRVEHFGHAKRVVVKPLSTTMIADVGENQFLNKRLAELRNQVTEATDEAQRLRLQGRLARLAGGIAVIKVGAATELEMNARKERVEDAMLAAKCAKDEGVLVGGGIALLRAWEAAAFVALELEGDEKIGAQIIKKACSAPLRTLAENGGESPDFILKGVTNAPAIWNGCKIDAESLKQSNIPGGFYRIEGTPKLEGEFSANANYGWNARTREFGDLVEQGVLDPLRVVRVALESAASVSALMLITHCLVAQERPK